MNQSLARLLSIISTVCVVLVLVLLLQDTSIQPGGLSLWWVVAVLCFGIQWIAFIPANLYKTEKYYDLSGSITYQVVILTILVSCYLEDTLTTKHLVLGSMVLIWSGRLGSFLFRRIQRDGKDGRFDHIKPSSLFFFLAWTLQGLWVFLTLMSVNVLLLVPSPETAIGVAEVIGWTLWGIGFGIEVIADRQKSTFNQNPTNKGKWISQGLWAYSQHPNYFGEILLWTGIFISGVSQYQGTQWLALLSPAFVTLLLTQISGIPLLRARSDKRWGKNEDYRAYRAPTSVLFPLPRGSFNQQPSHRQP